MTSRTFTLPGRYWRRYGEDGGGYEVDELLISSSSTALVLVDVDGVGTAEHDASPALTALLRDVVRTRLAPALAAARVAGLPVLYVCNALLPGTTARNQWHQLSLRTSGVDVSREWAPRPRAFEPSIAPLPSEPVILKQLYSGFVDTNLDAVLRAAMIDTVVLAGFDGAICLYQTAVDALNRGYRVVALRDATYTAEYPDAPNVVGFVAIRGIEANVGYTANASEFVAGCQQLLEQTTA